MNRPPSASTGVAEPDKKPQPERTPATPSGKPQAATLPPAAWGARAFVWGVWGLLLLSALAYLGKFAHNLPINEDWNTIVPKLVGTEPVSFHWLWQQEGEHRGFLMKVIILGLVKLTGDFRAVILVGNLALAGVALAMIRAAKSQRGWTSYTDAFFPLALLECGMSTAAFWPQSYAFYVPPTVLAGTVLAVMARYGTRLKLGSAIAVGVCLILLPLCGAAGLVYLPALALWSGYAGVRACRSAEPRQRRTGFVLLGLVAAALALVVLYFVDYSREASAYAAPSPNLATTVKASLAFLAGSFGSGTAGFWPYSGGLMAVVLILGGGVLLVAIRQEGFRGAARALGLLLFLGAVATLALAIGWGRSGTMSINDILRQAGYPILAVLVLCAVYLAWGVYRPQTVGLFAQMCLFTVMLGAAALDLQGGLSEGKHTHTDLKTFEDNMRAGMPPYKLLIHYRDPLNPDGAGDLLYLGNGMRELHRIGFGPFRDLQDDPPFTEEQVLPLLKPVETHGLEWKDQTAHASGPDADKAYVTFQLPKLQEVAGVRLKFHHSHPISGSLQIAWRNSSQGGFPEGPQYIRPLYILGGITFYVDDTIDQIRIYPNGNPHDKSFDCRFEEFVLLLPVPKERGH